MSLTITNPPRAESNPLAIRCITKPNDPYDSEVFRLTGDYARVSVRTGEDLAFIRLMRYGIDYHAPATGDGILIKAELLKA